MTHAASQSDRRILELLAAARKQSSPAPQAVEADDYDWSSPRRFTASQLQELAQLAGRAGAEIAAALDAQVHDDIKLSLGEISQSYAGQLTTADGQEANQYISLVAQAATRCGFVIVPAGRARRWVTEILGGSPAETEEKRLSAMEAALLTDIVAAGVGALGQVTQQAGGKALRCGKDIPSIADQLRDEPNDEYTLLPFCDDGQDQAVVLSFALASETIAPIVSPADESMIARPAEDVRKDVLACIEQVNVTCEIVLGTASLTMRDIANLEEGDVFLVHKMVGEPVELVVGGKVVLSGYPVRCNGRCALQIAAHDPTAPFGAQYQDEYHTA